MRRLYEDQTPLAKLRMDAPGSLRQSDVADYMEECGLKRARMTVSDFERAKIKHPDAKFIRLYAKAIGSTPAKVSKAHRATLRMKEQGTGPFVVGAAA